MTAVAEVQDFDTIPTPIVFTDSAADKVAQLIEDEGNPDLKLRGFVQGGGCSGFQYSFTFDDACNEDDCVIERDDARIVVDEMSWDFLSGAEIDFVEELIGAYFTIRNPNASSTCGCGTSFATD